MLKHNCVAYPFTFKDKMLLTKEQIEEGFMIFFHKIMCMESEAM
jgi:hypothetical protein